MTEQGYNNYDPAWQEKFDGLVVTAAEAVSNIKPGDRIFIGTGCAQPQELVEALVKRANELSDTRIVQLFTKGNAPYADRELAQNFRVNSFFISENIRELIDEGLADYTPIFLSEIPGLFSSGQLPLDAALIQVTPPDSRGMCSLGISVDIVKSAAENASLVIAQVNPHMPRTHGDSSIHIHDIDFLVPVDTPLLEIEPLKINDVAKKIGQNVASLIENGSTIELGLGSISQSVSEFLKDKKDLGIHTEMFTDSIIDLVESGVVTGAHKSVDRGRIVASFCMGTRKLYDYINDNPVFSFHPTEYVNAPSVIGKQNRQIAVNTALEIDLTGQVCADSLGDRFFSGIGGQADFNRGAALSHGGKAIIAIPSTAKDGKVSRIVSRLSPGAGVVTTRGDIHYVVTEHGAAFLHGKSIQERALALISISHPAFREKLLSEAILAKYLPESMSDLEGRFIVGSAELRATLLQDDGILINFRPIHPTDPERIKDMFYALSEQSVYLRFMHKMKRIAQKQIKDLVFIDHRNEVTIVGTLQEAYGEEIIAMGGYYLNPRTNRAEVAFLVRDGWQRRNIGKFLLKHLTNIARRSGIAGFTAETLPQNKAMQTVFNNSGLKVSSKLIDGVYEYQMDF
jgi:acyl-CoA hydrolase/GNAT superfamily N-acetyltransferase